MESYSSAWRFSAGKIAAEKLRKKKSPATIWAVAGLDETV
jgi:hypothetical protein